MSFSHRLQGSRFELKYVIDERRAAAIRDFVRGHLVRDEHAPDTPKGEYVVSSLYLDSPDLTLARATQRGLRNRVKLRIRQYNNDPGAPVFFEIKRRDANVILKQRAAVRRDAATRLIRGRIPRRSDLLKPDGEQYGALERFCELSRCIGAIGQVFVNYCREAYVSPDSNAVRLTFDRRLTAAPFYGTLRIPDDRNTLAPRVRGVVLELKFTDRFPKWMREMVCAFDLDRGSMAKYVVCVEALRSTHLAGIIKHPREVAS